MTAKPFSAAFMAAFVFLGSVAGCAPPPGYRFTVVRVCGFVDHDYRKDPCPLLSCEQRIDDGTLRRCL